MGANWGEQCTMLDRVGYFHLTPVSKFANISSLNYSVEYFHANVQAEIESWPDGILADYARLI